MTSAAEPLPPAEPLVIGVTGLPCSGKSFAAGLLARGEVAGIAPGDLVKADDVGHAVLEWAEVREELRSRFGPGIDGATPAESRRLIAERVFADPADLAWLEALLHPLISGEVARAAKRAQAKKRGLVLEAALLTAAGLDRLCDVVFVLEAAFPVRLRRAEGRGWSEAELRRRSARQEPLFTPEKLAELGSKLIVVGNDQQTGELAGELAGAFGRAAAGKSGGRRIENRK